jgi:hypothetical protein
LLKKGLKSWPLWLVTLRTYCWVGLKRSLPNGYSPCPVACVPDGEVWAEGANEEEDAADSGDRKQTPFEAKIRRQLCQEEMEQEDLDLVRLVDEVWDIAPVTRFPDT